MPILDLEERRKYQLRWINKRRDTWIKENGPCRECGAFENLEVDHIDPATKKFHPRELWSRTEAVRIEELKKCQVLCEDCHKEKSLRDGSHPTNHGISGYTNRGCRCEICKAAKLEISRRTSRARKEQRRLLKIWSNG